MVENSENDKYLTEWQETRSTVARFDQTITDLRKYGFSFITGLMTADGFLLSYYKSSLSPGIAEAVILVTSFLICALQLFESTYLVYQKSAVWRAKIIERRINLELTDSISTIARMKHTAKFGFVTYPALLAALCIFAGTLLSENNENKDYFAYYLAIGAGVAEVLLYLIIRGINPKDLKDWAISNLEPSTGETVSITVTNMDEKKNLTKEYFGRKSWIIEDEQGNLVTLKPEPEIPEKVENSYTWNWIIPDGTEGKIYRILVPTGKIDSKSKKIAMEKLDRKIIVKDRNPLDILKLRLAKGEITKEDFKDMKKILE